MIAVPLLLTLLPEAPGVLLARGERDRAHAVADRYGLPRPTVVAAPTAGARGHLAAVQALFHPDCSRRCVTRAWRAWKESFGEWSQ
ncbi:hypothetical protein [Streptomyces sp. NPDC006739]|uniref:hypothetical protein n=1 Tax=Streptomyces sp. NPDC006739 TaxID=3364763 RepID=UPI0036BFED96